MKTEGEQAAKIVPVPVPLVRDLQKIAHGTCEQSRRHPPGVPSIRPMIGQWTFEHLDRIVRSDPNATVDQLPERGRYAESVDHFVGVALRVGAHLMKTRRDVEYVDINVEKSLGVPVAWAGPSWFYTLTIARPDGGSRDLGFTPRYDRMSAACGLILAYRAEGLL